MRTNILTLIERYKFLIKKVERNMKEFPEQEAVLIARRNVYKDIILDLDNILELHKEDDNGADLHIYDTKTD